MGNINSASLNESVEDMIYYPPECNYHEYVSALCKRNSICDCTLTIAKTKEGYDVPIFVARPHRQYDKYIVFSHGNGSDNYGMRDYVQYLVQILNVCVICYDYVGYGISNKTKPSEELCYQSIQECMDFVLNRMETKKIDPSKVFLIGQSLGTGVTVDYAFKNNWITPIMLISPYKSIDKVGIDMISGLSSTTSLTTSLHSIAPFNKFDTESKIRNLVCPVKIFHGTIDQVINISHSQYLYKILPNKDLELTTFENVGHNDILGHIKEKDFEELFNYKVNRNS
jgi:pimeloyl-ACP methyl ester carboxylesterase